MRNLVIGIFLGAVLLAWGQSPLGIGVQPATGFATTLTGCQTVSTGFNLCVVTPASGQPFLALSVAGYNSGAPFAVSASANITGTAPIVVTGNTVSCPTCVAGSVVNTFQGRTGNVLLTKPDVLGTGVAATTTLQ